MKAVFDLEEEKEVAGDTMKEERSKKESSEEPTNWLLLVSTVGSLVLMGVGFSLKGPFYPPLAASKGIPPSQYSFTLSALEITVVITSIPVGNFVYFYGPKQVCLIGFLFQGIGNIGIGMCELVDDVSAFLAISIVSRCFEGFGQILLYVGLFAIIVSVFSSPKWEMMSKTEFAFGCGMIIGPFVCGAIMDATSFMFTFVLVGFLLLLMIPLMYFIIPNYNCKDARQPDDKFKILTIFKLPSVWISIVVFVASKIDSGFGSVALSPYLGQFNLSDTSLGLTFTGSTFAYTTGTLVWGVVIGCGVSPFLCMLIGMALMMVSQGTVGPMAWTSAKPSLYFSVPAMMIGAFGNAGTLIPGLLFLRKQCAATGFSSNVDVNANVSSIYSHALSFGGIIGPIIGGVAFEHLGFRRAQFVFMMVFVVLFLCYVPIYIISKIRRTDAGKEEMICEKCEPTDV